VGGLGCWLGWGRPTELAVAAVIGECLKSLLQSSGSQNEKDLTATATHKVVAASNHKASTGTGCTATNTVASPAAGDGRHDFHSHRHSHRDSAADITTGGQGHPRI
jgi:hypothetical protein